MTKRFFQIILYQIVLNEKLSDFENTNAHNAYFTLFLYNTYIEPDRTRELMSHVRFSIYYDGNIITRHILYVASK